jgi:hypothetical protein
MWSHNPTASGTLGAVALLAAFLMWTVGRGHWPKFILALVITGTAGLMKSRVGDWVRSPINWLNNAISGVAGWLGIGLSLGIIVGVLVYVLVRHIKDDGIDEKTLGLSAGITLTAGMIPGWVGVAVTTVLGIVIEIVALIFKFLLGIH